jgi:hypothetical protein
MTDLEDRLRRDLGKFASRARPEVIRGPQTPQVRRASRTARRLAPAAAALAIVGVIAGVSLAGAIGPRTASGQRTQAQAAPGMPPHYVTVVRRIIHGDTTVTTTAVVHDSATGAALASVDMPTLVTQGSVSGPFISAANDDRTFVITETGGNPPNHRLAWFFLLHVTANGRSARLTRLPISVPGALYVEAAVLSPDGSRLAMQEQSCYSSGCYYTGIRVVTLATGAVRTWTTHVGGAPWDVSWAGNSTVAFHWADTNRLLNVSGAGGNLLTGPTVATPAEPAAAIGYITFRVTPDLRTVITTTVQNIPDGHGTDTVVAKIVELEARTGKLLRILSTTTEHRIARGYNLGETASLDDSCYVLSLAPSGPNVLADCFGFGRTDGSGFTPLPGFPSASSTGISGEHAAAW